MNHNLYLRDQKTGTRFKLVNGQLPLANLPDKYTLVVEPVGKAGSVEFTLNGKRLPIENIAPFCAAGDLGTVSLNAGKNDLEIRIFEKKGGKGKLLEAAEYELLLPKPAPLPDHPLIKGICEYFSAPIGKAGPLLKAMGIHLIRGWHTIDWESLPPRTLFDDVADWRKAGFNTILCATTKQPPKDARQVKEWFARAFEVAGKVIDYWEIGNEPNLNTEEARRSVKDAYWIGTTKSHFDRVFVPAAETLKAKAAAIIGPAISKDLAALKIQISAGLPQLATFAGYHPYGYNVREHSDNLAGAHALCGPLPLAVTEWNFHAADAAMWQRGIKECLDALKRHAAIGCYYRGEKNSQPAGKHGIFKADFSPHEPYYSQLRAIWSE